MEEILPHQREGIEFLKKIKRGILADEMGLGKTRQAIVSCIEDGAKNILVICTASIKINWEREIKMIYPQATTFVIQSGPEQELEEKEWTIVNYDILPKYQNQILKLISEGKLDTVIVDEAHYIKGKKTIRAVKTLDIASRINRVYVMTGTPIMNRPVELFNLLRAIKHPLGRNRTFFSKRYCGGHFRVIAKKNGGIIRFWEEKGATNLVELKNMIEGVMLRRLKKEVTNLPDKIISIQICELDRAWKRKYDTTWDEYIDWISSNPEGKDIENILDAQHLVEITKLKQVCSLAKVDRIVSDIRSAVEQGEKVIVFSQYTNTIKLIAEKLGEEKRASAYGDKQDKVKCVTLTGSNTQTERQKSVDAFQNDEDTKVFIANIIAGGVGINLTKASIVMFADMEWSPELHAQAIDRAHRIGQTGTVNVYYYVLADTIEEDIVDILSTKKSIIQTIVDGKESDGIEESSMAGQFLKRLKEKIKIST